MIQLTRLNSRPFAMNCDLIEQIEETPDTIITLTNGKKVVVAEPTEAILEKIIEYRIRCFRDVNTRMPAEIGGAT